MERRMIPVGFVDDALAGLRAAGLASGPLLARAGLPGHVTEPVSADSYGRLWWLIAQALEDEFFGLAARPMRPGSFALLCQVVLHARDLEEALRRALLFLAIVLDDPRGDLQIRDGEAVIALTDAGPPRCAFTYRTYWLILMGVACWLVRRRLPLRRIEFPGQAPAGREDYLQFFGVPVQFARARSTLSFDAVHLSLPIVRDEQALAGFLRKAPGNILVRYRHDQGVIPTVRQLLDATPPARWPAFDDLSRQLKLTPVTLRRRLRVEGQSYAAIRDELRGKWAMSLLAAGRLSISEIATELGYSEPSAFYRAFQKWTGTSPRASTAETGSPTG